jgi:DNA-binding NarL/FixJ family response regulator
LFGVWLYFQARFDKENEMAEELNEGTWGDEETRKLIALKKSGRSNRQIARLLNRAESSVHSKIVRLRDSGVDI